MSRAYRHTRGVEVLAWAKRQDEVTPADVRARFGLTVDNSAQILSRLHRRGLLLRLRLGTYAVAKQSTSNWYGVCGYP